MSNVQYNFNGRTAIVTGGAQGIGLALVHRMMRSGAEVAILDLAAPSDAEVKQKALHLTTDVTRLGDVQEAFKQIVARFGSIDIIVNSAGVAGANASTWEYDIAEWRRIVDINLLGTFLVCRTGIPFMLERNCGRIVNIASIAGKEGNPNASAYSAAKAAVIGLTKSLGKELAGTNIRVNAVAPAAVRTAIFDQMSPAHIEMMLSKIPLGRFGAADEIASLCLFLCSDECSFSTGAVFDASGGRAVY